jgi:hypothetical protein
MSVAMLVYAEGHPPACGHDLEFRCPVCIGATLLAAHDRTRRLTTEATIEALAHGLMDYLAHEHNMPLLHRPEIRDDAIVTYRHDVEEYLLPRLHELEIQQENP